MADWTPLAAWFEREIGFVLVADRHYLIESACKGLLAETGCATPAALAEAGSKDHRLRQRLINAMTINESFFFRDVGLWEDLSQRVLPELDQECAFRKRIDVLLCACSRGQEVYSLAMTAAERNGLPLAITAADIDTDVLRIAQEGIYSELEVTRGLSDARRERFFRKLGPDRWQVRPELQRGISFTQMNLNTAFSFPARYDIVLCRNVLIYFSMAARKTIVERLAGFTNPWGWFVLGGAETMLGVSDAWVPRRIGRTTFYQKPYKA